MKRIHFFLLAWLGIYPVVRILLHIAESITVLPHSTSLNTLIGHYVFAIVLFLPTALIAVRPHRSPGQMAWLCTLGMALTMILLDGTWYLFAAPERREQVRWMALWDIGRYVTAAILTGLILSQILRRFPMQISASIQPVNGE